MARERVVICGHGASRPHVNAYTKVPRGCTISFYTDYAKTLHGEEGPAIAGDTLGRDPSLVIAEYHTCPNLMYFPLTEGEKDGFVKAKHKDTLLTFCDSPGGFSLEQLFNVWGALNRQFDFHWGCCQALQLKNSGQAKSVAAGGSYDATKFVGNPKTNVNLVQKSDGYYQFDYSQGKYVKVAVK